MDEDQALYSPARGEKQQTKLSPVQLAVKPETSQSQSPVTATSSTTEQPTKDFLTDPLFIENFNEQNVQNDIIKSTKPIDQARAADMEDEDDEVDGRGKITEMQTLASESNEEVSNNFNDDHDLIGQNLSQQQLQECPDVKFRGNNIQQTSTVGIVSDEGEAGWASDVSSQGSMSSMEYINKNVEGIYKNMNKLNKVLQHGENFPSKPIYNAVSNFFRDRHSVKGFLSYVRHSIMSNSFSSGACERNSREADVLEKQLGDTDDTALLGIIGRILVENSTRDEEVNTDTSRTEYARNEVMNVDETEAQQVEKMRVESGREFSERNFTGDNGPSSTRIFPEEPLPSVPDYRPVVHTEPRVLTAKSKDKELKKSVKVTEETWEIASDAFKDNDTLDRQIEKVGQVFFDAVFTEEEIKNCTVSGKKGTRKFNSGKVRFIRGAVAFIVLNQPTRRTTKAFEKAIKDDAFTFLSGNQFMVIKTKVLTEYAYRRRKTGNGQR